MFLSQRLTLSLFFLSLAGLVVSACSSLTTQQTTEKRESLQPPPKSVESQEQNVPVYEEPIFLPSIELPEIKGSVTQQSPVRLINLRVIVSKSKKRALVIEIENVSKKPVILAEFLVHYPQCDKFLYKGGPFLRYGDAKIANPDDLTPFDPVLQPGQKASKTFDNELINELLDRKTFKSCPEGKNRPHMNLLKVWFEDGTIWDPVEAEMQYRKSQQQKPKS